MVSVRLMEGVAGPVINALLSVMVGMVLWGVRAINGNLKALNGRLVEHVENKDLHYAAQARTEEQIKHLLQTITVAHQRLDRLQEKVVG